MAFEKTRRIISWLAIVILLAILAIALGTPPRRALAQVSSVTSQIRTTGYHPLGTAPGRKAEAALHS